MRNDNAKELVAKKQVYVEGYSPKQTALNEDAVQRLRRQLNDPRVVVGVQQIGSLQGGAEFQLLKIFLPIEVVNDEAKGQLQVAEVSR